jgi:hypothetical protein
MKGWPTTNLVGVPVLLAAALVESQVAVAVATSVEFAAGTSKFTDRCHRKVRATGEQDKARENLDPSADLAIDNTKNRFRSMHAANLYDLLDGRPLCNSVNSSRDVLGAP